MRCPPQPSRPGPALPDSYGAEREYAADENLRQANDSR